jgi:outer membrane lipoprotein SlyB
MLKPRHIVTALLALGLAACAAEPTYYNQPAYSSVPGYGPRDVAYNDTGRVVAIDVVRGGGRTSGGGAVAGAIVGGVLGHQVGSGRGNDVATAAGAIGGAVAGNEIERRRNDDEQYRVVVQFRDGREATFMQGSLDGLRVGDRVRADGDRLFRD